MSEIFDRVVARKLADTMEAEVERLRAIIDSLIGGTISVSQGWDKSSQQNAWWGEATGIHIGPYAHRLDAVIAAYEAAEAAKRVKEAQHAHVPPAVPPERSVPRDTLAEVIEALRAAEERLGRHTLRLDLYGDASWCIWDDGKKIRCSDATDYGPILSALAAIAPAKPEPTVEEDIAAVEEGVVCWAAWERIKRRLREQEGKSDE